ncbi:Large ribosomal subunit protein bL25 [Candidatus Magnetomoraceae bacterium gMMP-15]
MNFIDLKANIRTQKGKSAALAMRRDGLLPAVIYGPGADTLCLSISIDDLDNVFKKADNKRFFLNLIIQNGSQLNKKAMIKELQTDVISGKYLHIDFYEVSMDKKIKVMVPITTKGKSIGVEEGGLLQIIRRELEVYCLPGSIPEAFEIDVTDLKAGDAIHIKDISVPEGTELPHDVDFTVLTVLYPKGAGEEAEEEATEEEEEEGAETTTEE